MHKTVVALSLAASLYATTFGELFDALRHHPVTKADILAVQEAKAGEKTVVSKFYPQVDLFAKYDHYTTPTGLLPVPPNELFPMIKDASKPQPFSQNIMREGIGFRMPIFIKTIFTLSDKAALMQQSAAAKKRLDLIKNEALIVGANADLLYLTQLEKSLQTKKRSLEETKKTITIKVDSGRSPKSALYKIEDALNQIDIAKNGIALQKEKLLSTIYSLTGITLQKPIDMKDSSPQIDTSNLGQLEPLRLKIKAKQKQSQASKEEFYPKIIAQGSYVFSQAKAYNNDKSLHETYGNIGIVLNIPLSMTTMRNYQKTKIELQKEQAQLDKAKEALLSKAKALQNSLPLLEHSIELAKKSVASKEKLLSIAKVSYQTGRLSTEEYLRYEDEVVGAKAKLYKAKAQKWQNILQLAVIYGNNIEEMVK